MRKPVIMGFSLMSFILEVIQPSFMGIYMIPKASYQGFETKIRGVDVMSSPLFIR